MYGNDVEKIIKFFSGLNLAISSIMRPLSNITIWENPVTISHITNPIFGIQSTMRVIYTEIKLIESKSFKDIHQINNSYGSPYTEIYNLNDAINTCASVCRQYPSVSTRRDLEKVIFEMHEVRHFSKDAKHAAIIYNEHVQQGYDKIIHMLEYELHIKQL